jgi:Phage integrase family
MSPNCLRPGGGNVARVFEKRLVHVRRSYTHGAEGDPKSGRVRSVPLIDQAGQATGRPQSAPAVTEREDLVFVDQLGRHVDDWRLRRRFHAALERAGLQKLRLHDLRHTFGTLAVQAFPLSDVRAYMGHADIQTTMLYVHHIPQIGAADRLSELVAAAQNPVSGHVRDTPADAENQATGEIVAFPAPSRWARLDSNQGPTDYESAALTS